MFSEEEFELLKTMIIRDVNIIIEQINRSNDNGRSQYICESIKKRVSEEIINKKYIIKYRETPNRTHDAWI